MLVTSLRPENPPGPGVDRISGNFGVPVCYAVLYLNKFFEPPRGRAGPPYWRVQTALVHLCIHAKRCRTFVTGSQRTLPSNECLLCHQFTLVVRVTVNHTPIWSRRLHLPRKFSPTVLFKIGWRRTLESNDLSPTYEHSNEHPLLRICGIHLNLDTAPLLSAYQGKIRLISSEVTLGNTCLNFLPREDHGDGEEAVDEMNNVETIRPPTRILARPRLSAEQESIGASGDAKHGNILCNFSSRVRCDR